MKRAFESCTIVCLTANTQIEIDVHSAQLDVTIHGNEGAATSTYSNALIPLFEAMIADTEYFAVIYDMDIEEQQRPMTEEEAADLAYTQWSEEQAYNASLFAAEGAADLRAEREFGGQ